jgi:hypothetical protein
LDYTETEKSLLKNCREKFKESSQSLVKNREKSPRSKFR